jgi:hypothetical protein
MQLSGGPGGMVEHLPISCKALSSNPCTKKKKKKKKKQRRQDLVTSKTNTCVRIVLDISQKPLRKKIIGNSRSRNYSKRFLS